MKKVIILCSALVFDFLTCSDASAYNAKFEAATIEEKLTELIGLANTEDEQKEMVQRYADKIKKLVNSKPQIWMGTGDLKIEDNGTVQFIGKFNQPHQGKNRSGKAKAQEILREIQRDIDRLRAERQRSGPSSPTDSSTSYYTANSGPSSPASGNMNWSSASDWSASDSHPNSPASGTSRSPFNEVTFNFENITGIKDVENLTQEQCRLAVKQGIIDREYLFSYGIKDYNEEDKAAYPNDEIEELRKAEIAKQHNAIDNIVEAVRRAGGRIKLANKYQNDYTTKIRVLITANRGLFNNVEFVKGIKKYLKVFHKEYFGYYNDAEIKKGHPYLRFLIIDKI